MKIRSKNLLIILPIFALLAGVNAWVSISSQKNELFWGQAEQLHSLTVAFAEMTGLSVEARQLRAAVQDKQLQNRISRSMELLKQYKLFSRLTVWEKLPAVKGKPAGVLFSWPGGKQEGLQPFPGGQPYKSGFFVSPTTVNAKGVPVKSGWLRLPGGGGVQIEIEAADYIEQLSRARFKSLLLLALSLLTGAAVSWFLSHTITKRLQELGAAAKQLAYEGGRLHVSPSSIREINDLSSTFNTMDSILRETVMRARRSMLDVEQFRAGESMVSAFQYTAWDNGPVSLQAGDAELKVAAFLGNSSDAGCFAGVLPGSDGRGWLFYGKTPGDDNDGCRQASAVDRLIRLLLPGTDAAAVLQRVSVLFSGTDCTVLQWNGGEQLQGVQLAGADGSCTPVSFALRPDRFQITGQIDRQAVETADPLFDLSTGLSLESFRHDLQVLIGHRLHGAVLLLKYTPGTGA